MINDCITNIAAFMPVPGGTGRSGQSEQGSEALADGIRATHGLRWSAEAIPADRTVKRHREPASADNLAVTMRGI
jgi:hypothetical protein